MNPALAGLQNLIIGQFLVAMAVTAYQALKPAQRARAMPMVVIVFVRRVSGMLMVVSACGVLIVIVFVRRVSGVLMVVSVCGVLIVVMF